MMSVAILCDSVIRVGRFAFGPSGPSRQEVWRWWEERLLRSNRDLFIVGIATWLLVLVAGPAAVKPGANQIQNTPDFGDKN